jgi:4-hydroxybenzoate polyprenyltransferase
MPTLKEIREIPGFVKLSHSVFALPFALASVFLASRGTPSLRILFLVIAAVITARFSAMAFNRVVDRDIDALNPRTANRHLPHGSISLGTARMLLLLGAVLFVAISFLINPLAGWLSPIALVVILGYSYTKRFTSFSHFVLGAALGLAPWGAWVAIRSEVLHPVPLMLAGAVVCWVAGFDIIYALQDEAFDRKQGLHSMVVKLGAKRALLLVRALHFVMLWLLVEIGIWMKLPLAYYLGLIVVLISLAWEHWLMRQPNHSRIQLAFLQANAMASFGYLAAAIMGVYLG